MPDSYGIVFDSFFEGETGRAIQAKGKDAVLVATFLLKNKSDNMIGLYELPLLRIARTLTATTRSGIRRALQALADLHFAYYDAATEFVWVRELARVRLQLKGVPLAADDKRRLGAVKLYDSLPLNPFLGPFYDRYAVELGLTHRREGASDTPLEGASEGAFPPPQTPPPVPEQQDNRKQETGTRDQETENRNQVPERAGKSAAASPRPSRAQHTENAEDTVLVIAALVEKELLPMHLTGADLTEATKERCAHLGIPYDGRTVGKAIECAEFRARVKQPIFAERKP